MIRHSSRSPISLPAARPWLAAACLLAVAACKGGDAGGAGDSAQPAAAGAAAGSNGKALIAVVRAADWIGSEWSEDAIRVGLQEAGLEEGKDFEFKMSSAQGDLATLPSLIDRAVDEKARVIVTLQDPTLKAAVARAKDTPVVFHVLSDPFTAGAGKSDTDHAANITGVYSPGFGDPEQEKRLALIRQVVPKARRIGILFSADEPYAVAMKDKLTSAGQRAKVQVVAVPVTSVGEGGDAVRSLLGQRVDAIEIFGNSAHAAFPTIIKAANESKVPVFSPSPFEMLQGAVASIYPDFAEGGIVAGQMIGRIIKGESPAKIPFHKLETTRTTVSAKNAQAANVSIPADLAKQAAADSARRRP